jgi:hypothetical protein
MWCFQEFHESCQATTISFKDIWQCHLVNDRQLSHVPNSTTLYPISFAQNWHCDKVTLGKRYGVKCGAIGRTHENVRNMWRIIEIMWDPTRWNPPSPLLDACWPISSFTLKIYSYNYLSPFLTWVNNTPSFEHGYPFHNCMN